MSVTPVKSLIDIFFKNLDPIKHPDIYGNIEENKYCSEKIKEVISASIDPTLGKRTWKRSNTGFMIIINTILAQIPGTREYRLEQAVKQIFEQTKITREKIKTESTVTPATSPYVYVPSVNTTPVSACDANKEDDFDEYNPFDDEDELTPAIEDYKFSDAARDTLEAIERESLLNRKKRYEHFFSVISQNPGMSYTCSLKHKPVL